MRKKDENVQQTDKGCEEHTCGSEKMMEQEFTTLPKKCRSSKQNDDVGVKISRQTRRNAKLSDSSDDEDCVSGDSNLSHSQGQANQPVS